jgi:hypothetical protein
MHRPDHPPQRTPRAGSHLPRFLSHTLLAAGLVVGCFPAPGHGAKAGHGYRRAAPVIVALAAYRRDSAKYPIALADLVRHYLPAQVLALPEQLQEEYPLKYHVDSTGYVLEFRYTGPGMNRCDYSSKKAAWECSGLF